MNEKEKIFERIKKYGLPFPFFGGKSKVAPIVWDYFRDIKIFIDPFFGGGSVPLLKPDDIELKMEIYNDKDPLIINFWRSIKYNPDEVAYYASDPLNNVDLLARGIWIVKNGLPELRLRIFADPYYYDARIAGWWVWSVCGNISLSNYFVRGNRWTEVDGKLVDKREMPDYKYIPGVNNIPINISNKQGIFKESIKDLDEYFKLIQSRLRNAIINCGDYKSVLRKAAITRNYKCGIFLDPPYDSKYRYDKIYSSDLVDRNISKEINQWCIENSDSEKLLIILCGYEGEHNNLEDLGWGKIAWKAGKSLGNSVDDRNNINRTKERLWISPSCLKEK